MRREPTLEEFSEAIEDALLQCGIDARQRFQRSFRAFTASRAFGS